jgi:3'-phosphoadenosine 5'-phosphosulfate sulfotransferase (PAPS reductase)/FAD synthetase
MDATEILNAAIDEHNPSHVFALFSGGDDSVCAAHLAAQHPRFTAAVLIDTGIAIQEAHDHAKTICAAHGWPLLIYKTPNSYDAQVLAHGFPGPSQHNFMYNLFKKPAIRALVRDHKRKKKDRILLVTGMRRQESIQRMQATRVPILRIGAQVWTAPMWEWSRDERDAYQAEHHLERNPIKEKMHISGDCLCGAFREKGDLEIMRIFFPREAERITRLQEQVQARFPWAWDDAAPEWFSGYKAGQQFLGDEFMPLCWSCERRQVTP